MSKVHPDPAAPDPVALPAFKKPAQMTPPLTEWDPAYLKRRAAINEQIFTLCSGRKRAFFTEGEPTDPAVVCLPPSGFGKSVYIPREPIPGVFLIVIDGMGKGNSSPIDGPITFKDDNAEVVELLNELQVEKFYVIGWSRGAIHALQMAAGLPERVLGVASMSAPFDVNRPGLSQEDAKKLGDMNTMKKLDQQGCVSYMLRKMFVGMYWYPDKSVDFGFAGREMKGSGYSYYKSKATGGAPVEFESAHFTVCKLLDGELHGANSKFTVLYEFQGMFCTSINPTGHSFDTANIKCPCFIYNCPKEETPLSNAELYHKIIPGSELIVLKEHGHTSIIMEFEKIVEALVQGQSAKCSYIGSQIIGRDPRKDPKTMVSA